MFTIYLSTQWCRRRGWRRASPPPNILNCWKSLKIGAKSVKTWAKSMKIFAKYLKIWANYLKVRAKMAPNVVWFWQIGAQFVHNHMKIFFGVHPKRRCAWSVWEEILAQRVTCKPFGKFGEIPAKIFCTPKHLPARTRMCRPKIILKVPTHFRSQIMSATIFRITIYPQFCDV